MRKLLSLLMFLGCCAGAFAQFPFVDPLSGAGPVGLGSNYTTVSSGTRISGVIQKNAGVLSFSSGVNFDPVAESIYTGQTLDNDHSVQFIYGPDNIQDSNTSPMVRVQAGTGNGYAWNYTTGAIKVWTGGTATDIVMTQTCPVYFGIPTGHALKVAAVGSTIFCWDATAGTFGYGTDTTYPTGSPGLMVGSFTGHISMSGPLVIDCYPVTCNAPVANQPSGYFPSLRSVQLQGKSGWTIGYTTDGTTPTASNGTITHGTTYANSVPLSTGATTVQFLASKSGQINSAITTNTYNVGYTPPTIAGCPMFPPNSIFNTRIDNLPASSQLTAQLLNDYGTVHLHADFGQGPVGGNSGGIPFNVNSSTDPTFSPTFIYSDESDVGPYHINSSDYIENTTGQGCQDTSADHATTDNHLLNVVVGPGGSCHLEETYQASCTGGSTWTADSGAIWDTTSNQLRPLNSTSADAAGLPMMPLLLRCDEIASGTVNHALRMTFNATNQIILWPARHQAEKAFCADSTNCAVPSMGLRFRLKANVDISGYSKTNQIILTAMKQYGIFNADNGQTAYFSGVSGACWNNTDLGNMSNFTLSDFEAVDMTPLMVDPDSGEAVQPPPYTTPQVSGNTAHKGKFN